MLNDAVAFVIPDVHAEGKVRLGFHGQVRLDSSWPAGIYTPTMADCTPDSEQRGEGCYVPFEGIDFRFRRYICETLIPHGSPSGPHGFRPVGFYFKPQR
jgi:hypothetical protein